MSVVDFKLEYEHTRPKWPGRKSRGIKPTRRSRSISGSGTRNAYDVVAPGLVKTRRAVSKPRTSSAVVKKVRDTMRTTYVLSMPVAMLTLLLTLLNTTFGKLKGWVKRLWMHLSWPETLTTKNKGTPSYSIGNRSSRKISMWDRLFAYISLVIFAGLAIRPEVVSDTLPRVVIVLLATHSIIRRFR